MTSMVKPEGRRIIHISPLRATLAGFLAIAAFGLTAEPFPKTLTFAPEIANAQDVSAAFITQFVVATDTPTPTATMTIAPIKTATITESPTPTRKPATSTRTRTRIPTPRPTNTPFKDSSCRAQLGNIRLDTKLQTFDCTLQASEQIQADLQDSQGQVFILTRPPQNAKVGVGLSSPQQVDNCPKDGQRCKMIQHEITTDHHGDWDSLNVSGDRNTKGRWRLYLDNLTNEPISVVLNIRTISMSCSGGVFIEERIDNGPLIKWGPVCSGGIFDVDGSWNANAANGH